MAENYPANPYTLFNTFKQLVSGLQLLFVSPSVLSSYHKKERELWIYSCLKWIEKNLSCQEFECLTQVLISQNYFRFSPKILLTRTSMAKNLKLIRLKQIDGIGSIIDKSKYLSHCAIQAWTVFRYLYDYKRKREKRYHLQ